MEGGVGGRRWGRVGGRGWREGLEGGDGGRGWREGMEGGDGTGEGGRDGEREEMEGGDGGMERGRGWSEGMEGGVGGRGLNTTSHIPQHSLIFINSTPLRWNLAQTDRFVPRTSDLVKPRLF